MTRRARASDFEAIREAAAEVRLSEIARGKVERILSRSDLTGEDAFELLCALRFVKSAADRLRGTLVRLLAEPEQEELGIR
jgi:glycine cleavage system aminomethyltransferase T